MNKAVKGDLSRVRIKSCSFLLDRHLPLQSHINLKGINLNRKMTWQRFCYELTNLNTHYPSLPGSQKFHVAKIWWYVILLGPAMKPRVEYSTFFFTCLRSLKAMCSRHQRYKNRKDSTSLRFLESPLGKEMLRKAMQMGKCPLTSFRWEILLLYKFLNHRKPG